MAKNKPKGVSMSKTSSIRELIREDHHEQSDQENKVEAPGTPVKAAPPMSRPQFNSWVTAYILADAAIQQDASGVYDVLARNFLDSGMLSWWLQRIGHGDMTKLGRRKDLFDYLRLVSNALHRKLKHELGRPVARM